MHKDKSMHFLENAAEDRTGKQGFCAGREAEDVLHEHCTGSELENKCIKLFFGALRASASSGNDKRAALLSSQIVSAISQRGKLGDSKFVRSKLLNLKDRGNPQLASGVFNGIISPEEFVGMSQDEMKSDSLRKMEDEMHKRSLLDMQIAEPQAEVGMFECQKCKQRKCTYFQMQTRSADEPMTTYVRCICGHRWKF